jgi:hypothetical protein
LKNLLYLNLTRAEIRNENLSVVKSLGSLKTLHLFQCNISSQAYQDLKNFLPNVKIDTGGYFVPTLASDTTEITAAMK